MSGLAELQLAVPRLSPALRQELVVKIPLQDGDRGAQGAVRIVLEAMKPIAQVATDLVVNEHVGELGGAGAGAVVR